MSQLVSSVLEAYLFQFLNLYHMFFRHNVKDIAIAIHEMRLLKVYFQGVANYKVNTFMWWEMLDKPGIKKLGIQRGKYVNRAALSTIS